MGIKFYFTNGFWFIIGVAIGMSIVISIKEPRVPVSDGDSPQTVRELIQSLEPEYEVVVRRVKND